MNRRRGHSSGGGSGTLVSVVMLAAAFIAVEASCSPESTLFGPGRGEGGASSGPGGGAGGANEGGSPVGASVVSSVSSSSSGGVVCGDGVCQPTESSVQCPADCPTSCEHGICEVGGALEDTCESCVEQVCARDAFCCESAWDDICIQLVDQLCEAGCCADGACDGQSCAACPEDCGACECGDGVCEGESCEDCPADCGPCAECPHTVCGTGGPLGLDSCPDPCVEEVCAREPGCCSETDDPAWGTSCTVLAQQLCDADPCVVAVCQRNPGCCTQAWGPGCVEAAEEVCDLACDCQHGPCSTGPALEVGCDPCVEAVCAADAFCCASAWDDICVDEVTAVCGVSCD